MKNTGENLPDFNLPERNNEVYINSSEMNSNLCETILSSSLCESDYDSDEDWVTVNINFFPIYFIFFINWKINKFHL